MSETLHWVTWYGGNAELKKTIAKVRPGELAAAYQIAGIPVVVADDLPPGVLAIMGYRNADGSFQEGAVRLVND